MHSLFPYPPTANHRAVKARCPLRSRIRAEWQSVRACAAVARCDILLTADADQSAGGAFTFPDRLAVGRLTLDQLTVVRIHVREPDSHASHDEARSVSPSGLQRICTSCSAVLNRPQASPIPAPRIARTASSPAALFSMRQASRHG